MSSTIALQAYLAPLIQLLEQPGVEELIMNRPNEVLIEKAGEWEVFESQDLSMRRLEQLADLVATSTQQRVGPEHPLLSAYLPAGQRLQVVMPPACVPDTFGLAIRQPSRSKVSLSDLAVRGAFNPALRAESENVLSDVDGQLCELYFENKIEDFLRLAVRSKKNIVISGGTSSGKTTFLKSLTDEFGAEERILTIEDVPEIQLTQYNKLQLVASKGGQGVACVTVGELLEACLRLRPDRILLGEMRGAEAADFLELINTGHPGSISTIHAGSPQLCFERLCFMVKRKEGFQTMVREDLLAYIKSVVHIVVQFNRFDHGVRGMSGLWFRHVHEPSPGMAVPQRSKK